jgi:hypothetical protein
MTHEELGMIILKSKKFKFPKTLIDENLIMYSSTNITDESLDNFELTEKAIAILNGKEYKKEMSQEDFESYYNKFTANYLGINKVAFSPKQKVKSKLQTFMQKYKVSLDIILEAVDYYHRQCALENRIMYSSDAQYFIEKNGASLLLDIISDMNNPSQSISYSKLV